MYFARTLTFWRDVLVKLLKLFANLLTSFCELFKIERERKGKELLFFPRFKSIHVFYCLHSVDNVLCKRGLQNTCMNKYLTNGCQQYTICLFCFSLRVVQ